MAPGETAKGFNRFLDGSQTSSEKQFSGMMTGGPSLLVFQISIDGDIAKRVPKVGLIASQSHFASHGTFPILFVMSFRFLHTKERCFHCQQKSKFHLFSGFQNTTKRRSPCLMNLTPPCKQRPGFFERNISEATGERCFGQCLGFSVNQFFRIGRQEEA